MLRTTLRGTGVAIITPFNNSQEVDFLALGKLINFNIDKGVNYIVTLGTTGETPVLTKEEKKEIIAFTYDQVKRRVPVVVGIGGNNTAEVIEDVKSFDLSQATAVLSASPYYNKPSQEGLFQHYQAIAQASSKPVILYNVPGRTGKNMEAHTTLRLATEVKNIAGIKEASGDMQQCMEILRDRPLDFLVVSGDDALALPQMACGMDGVISVAANCFPKHFSQLIQKCLANDYSSASALNNSLLQGYKLLFSENNPAGVKAFLYEMGMIENVLRLPCVAVSGALQKEIKIYLQRLEEI
ncbi:MAG: 4-hydroxy-tetrahydrodipicolinate synthase [Ferruginibacter sp.]